MFKQKLKKISKQLKGASKLHAGQAGKIDKMLSSGPFKMKSPLKGTKDACYHKVKSRYKVWPSAYASGALVQCRKKGAKNWGNKSK